MHPVYSDPREGVPAKAAGALSRFDRDDPRYWGARPDDHNHLGLYREGPQEAVPPATRLARLTRGNSQESAEPPRAAHGRMKSERLRRARLLDAQLRFVAAVAGKRTRANPRRHRAA